MIVSDMQNTIRERIGKNLRSARERARLSRQDLVDALNESPKAPAQDMKLERLRQWEYGNNQISIDWIPALCDVLSCDIGYLFGEYPEHYRSIADIVTATGLSEMAAHNIDKYQGSLMIHKLSDLLERRDFWEMLNLFETYSNIGPEIITENKKAASLLLEAAKQTDNKNISSRYENSAAHLTELRYRYSTAKAKCHVILDSIVNSFLPDIR